MGIYIIHHKAPDKIPLYSERQEAVPADLEPENTRVWWNASDEGKGWTYGMSGNQLNPGSSRGNQLRGSEYPPRFFFNPAATESSPR